MHPHSTLSIDSTQDRRHKTCPICGKVFRVKPSHYDKSTYCSRSCMAEGYKTRLAGSNNPNYKDAALRTCATCNKEFTSYNRKARYCSRGCWGKDVSHREQLRVGARERGIAAANARWAGHKPLPKRRNNTCVTCGTVFSMGDLRRRYCNECQVFSRTGIGAAIQRGRLCVICGNYFEAHNSKKTCSPSCWRLNRARVQQGDRSHRWQGGKTSEALIVRGSIAYATWRETVFERDNYTCAMCNERGNKLAAHHIKPFATHEGLRMQVSNGITLCWPCHASIKGREHEYEEQFALYVVATVDEAVDMLDRMSDL